MPRTIEEGFDDFHDHLKLIKIESEAVKSHRISIKACLENNFELDRFFKTGSIGNGTNVNSYSDTDYFAVIPRKNLKQDSAATLRHVKEALQQRFSTTEGIHISSPAVVVPFGTAKSETTEIIPADFIKTENSVNIYDIPDGNGGWMKSSPKAHNDYVTNINSKLSNKAKPLIRFMKAWKFYNNVSIISFYLEMRIAKYASEEESIFYSIDINNILKNLINIDLSSMVNPSGIPGMIESCKSEFDKKDAISKLNTAYSRAEKAREEEKKQNIEDAFYWWNLFFSGKFPSYYR